jgi:WD40 repeat protein
VLKNEIPRGTDYLSWSGSDRAVAGMDHKQIHVWNAVNRKLEQTLEYHSRFQHPRSFACSHDGLKAARGSIVAHVVRIHNLSRALCEKVLAAHDEAAREADRWAYFREGRRRVNKEAMNKQIANKNVRDMVWSNDDSLLLSMCTEFIALRNAETSECIQTVQKSGGIP